MRRVRTAVAALAMAGAIGGAIAAGQTTIAPTVYIDNGPNNPPTEVDFALKDADEDIPGAWFCTEAASTPCYYTEYNPITGDLSGESATRGVYQPL